MINLNKGEKVMRKLKLWEEGNIPLWDPAICQDVPSISFMPAQGMKAPAMIICPGGSYIYEEMEKEGTKIGECLNSMGISSFVLGYRVVPYRHPCALIDIQRAIRYVRCNADELSIDPERVAVIGFSAGGHLAAMAATLFTGCEYSPADPVDRFSNRPDLVVLCYAPLNLNCDKGSAGLAENLYGTSQVSAEMLKKVSPAQNVNSNMPSAFIWTTFGDDLVTPNQALDFSSAMEKANVPFELHLYQNGHHGMGLARDDPSIGAWVDALGKWLRVCHFIQE